MVLRPRDVTVRLGWFPHPRCTRDRLDASAMVFSTSPLRTAGEAELQLKLAVQTTATGNAVSFETPDEKLHLAQRRNFWPHLAQIKATSTRGSRESEAAKVFFDGADGKLVAMLQNGSGYCQGQGQSVLYMVEPLEVRGAALTPRTDDGEADASSGHETLEAGGRVMHVVAALRPIMTDEQRCARGLRACYLGGLGLYRPTADGAFANEAELIFDGETCRTASGARVASCAQNYGATPATTRCSIVAGAESVLVLALASEWDSNVAGCTAGA